MASQTKQNNMARLSGVKLNHSIDLWEKTYACDANGGRDVQWTSLGSRWAHIMPSRARYPLVYEDQKHYRGAVYDVILREDPLVYQADKIVWGGKDLFYLYSPQKEDSGYLRIRLFAWEKKE